MFFYVKRDLTVNIKKKDILSRIICIILKARGYKQLIPLSYAFIKQIVGVQIKMVNAENG